MSKRIAGSFVGLLLLAAPFVGSPVAYADPCMPETTDSGECPPPPDPCGPDPCMPDTTF